MSADGLRVGLICRTDPEDPRSWSGTYFSALQALRARGLDIRVLPWEPRPPDLWTRVESAVLPRGKRGHEWARSRDHARAIEAALAQHPVDVLLAIAASTQSARLRSSVPLVTATDTTFLSVVETYPSFTGLSPAARRQGARLDRVSVSASAHVVYPSQWAAHAAQLHCGADPSRISVIPYGPNLAPPPHINERPTGRPATVLFVGVDWGRKGGDTAVAAVRALREQGREVRLVCIGATVPEHQSPHVDEALRFDRSTADGAAGLAAQFAGADALVLPSSADCSPIVLCEAAAFGLPAVTSDVGGIPEIVRDGVTGRVLPREASVASWAAALGDVLHPATAASMRVAARREFETSLNWERWAGEMERVLRLAAGATRDGAA